MLLRPISALREKFILGISIMCLRQKISARLKLDEKISFLEGQQLRAISKKGYWFQIAAEAKFQPEAYAIIQGIQIIVDV